MGKLRIRGVAVLIKNHKILLIYRKSENQEFWVLPGGGVEKNEQIENAVVREVKEEASIDCNITKLIYTHIYPDLGHKQFYYLCKYLAGVPVLGEYNEFQTMQQDNQVYEPQWVNVDKLSTMPLYPLEIRNWLIRDYKTNFKNIPRTAIMNSTDLCRKI